MKASRGASSPVVRCLGRSDSRERRCRFMLDARLGRRFCAWHSGQAHRVPDLARLHDGAVELRELRHWAAAFDDIGGGAVAGGRVRRLARRRRSSRRDVGVTRPPGKSGGADMAEL